MSQEWDEIALERYFDLISGNDLSYSDILKPNLLDSFAHCDLTNVLDVGCGVGVFTEELGIVAQNVLAIDISTRSIEIAKEKSIHKNIMYLRNNLIELPNDLRYTAVISNMTLMTIPDLQIAIQKISSMLNENGKFIFTITHPSFWPIYWGYAAKDDFDYNKETEIVAKFKTRLKTYNHNTRHFHRPLSTYFKLLSSNNFKIIKFEELRSANEKQWYPRFILMVCQKLN